jgi:hypothetical protein
MDQANGVTTNSSCDTSERRTRDAAQASPSLTAILTVIDKHRLLRIRKRPHHAVFWPRSIRHKEVATCNIVWQYRRRATMACSGVQGSTIKHAGIELERIQSRPLEQALNALLPKHDYPRNASISMSADCAPVYVGNRTENSALRLVWRSADRAPPNLLCPHPTSKCKAPGSDVDTSGKGACREQEATKATRDHPSRAR